MRSDDGHYEGWISYCLFYGRVTGLKGSRVGKISGTTKDYRGAVIVAVKATASTAAMSAD